MGYCLFLGCIGEGGVVYWKYPYGNLPEKHGHTYFLFLISYLLSVSVSPHRKSGQSRTDMLQYSHRRQRRDTQ